MSINDPVNGSTPPALLELALSGKLASAAGGETHLNADEAQAAHAEVAQFFTPASEEPAPAPAAQEAPAAPVTTDKPSSK